MDVNWNFLLVLEQAQNLTHFNWQKVWRENVKEGVG